MNAEKILVTLVGGPLDGHEIETWNDKDQISPGPHHLRECGCHRRPYYDRDESGNYAHAGYWSS